MADKDIRYGRAWRVGPTGVETGIDFAGDRHIVNIAHGKEEVWELLTFLQRNFPQLFAKWLTYHPEVHPVLKKHVAQPTITVAWAEKVFRYPSRTRKGVFHNVTLSRGRWSCDCEAAMYGNVCWAIQRAIGEEAGTKSPTEGR